MTGRDVLLLAEHRDGAPEPVTHQLSEQALKIAAAVGGRTAALVLCGPGAPVAERLRVAGIDTVYVVEDELLIEYNPEAYSKAATAVVRRLQPGLFLCGYTFQGSEVAPWVATTLEVPIIANCVELWVEGEDIVAERPVFGLAWQTRLSLPWRGTVVASMARRGGAAAARGESPPAPLERLDIDVGCLGIRTRVRGTVRPGEGEVDISRADVVVGVGRGIRDPANLHLVEELAATLGGVVACSRPLVDLGWMPHERQVGASGNDIHPKVYLAFGISGAAQHVVGIGEAQTIIAINQDAKAPIFRVAHHGVLGDLFQIVPALIAEAQRRGAVSGIVG